MRISKAGLAIIKTFEGFSPTPYLCPGGVWTIGYGHTKDVTSSHPRISKVQAEQYLLADVAEAEAAVARLVRTNLNTSQFSALVSLVFNIGTGAFSRSTLLKKLNRNETAADEFLRWVHVAGAPSRGLRRRREAERALFLSEDL